MTDFFTSLDRALAREDLATPQWFAPEPLENPSGIPPLPNSWQTLGYIDEAQGFESLPALMERINAAAVAKARALNSYSIMRSTAYDDNSFVIQWQDAEPRFLYGSPEWQRYLDDMAIFTPDARVVLDHWFEVRDNVPLADQELPAEGTE